MDEQDKKFNCSLEGTPANCENESDVDLELLNDFIVETKEHVEAIEAAALNLENANK